MEKGPKIAISGKSGCGNTTISRMVADSLGLEFINFTFRSLAVEHHIDLQKVLELAAQDDYWDKEVDSRQVQLARASCGCVLGSRLAIWMLPEAELKVYLRANPETRVGRIVKREGGGVKSVAAFTESRDRQDHDRYVRIYGIDIDSYEFADLIIDTETLGPAKIVEKIIDRLKEKNGHR
jgi:cytidylate kinase